MAKYIINSNRDEKGLNEVHTTECFRLPNLQNRIPLGNFSNAIEAVNYAKIHGWPNADGCWYCSPEAHRG